jgi:hypothetical protein
MAVGKGSFCYSPSTVLLIRYIGEIFESAINPLFFRKAVQRSAGRAFGYYLFFSTLHTVVLCVVGFWWLSDHWKPALDHLQSSLPSFEVGLNGGRLSTNLPEPITFEDEKTTMILDTSGQPVDLSAYDSAIAVTQTKTIFKKNRVETREFSYEMLPDFSLTTDQAYSWLGQHKQIVLWGVILTIGLGVIPTVWLFAIPAIFFLALLMLIPAAIFRSRLGYTQVLSIGFYAVTLPTLLETYFLTQMNIFDPSLKWVYLTWFLVGVIAARQEKPQGVSPTQSMGEVSGNSGIGS